MNTGLLLHEPFETYATSGAVGSHALGDFADSPLYFRRRHVDADRVTDTDSAAYAFGRFFHCYLLEGTEAVFDRYTLATEPVDRRTKEGKAAWAALEAHGKPIVSVAEFALAQRMKASLAGKSIAQRFLAHGAPEVTFRTEWHGVPVQCRVDWWHDQPDEWRRPTMVQLKTVERIADFARQFDRFAYYRQSAFYQLVVAQTLKLTGHYPRELYLVMEKSEPHDCALFEPGEASLELGRQECERLVQRLAHCRANDVWPGEPDEIQPLDLPDWKLAKNDAA